MPKEIAFTQITAFRDKISDFFSNTVHVSEPDYCYSAGVPGGEFD